MNNYKNITLNKTFIESLGELIASPPNFNQLNYSTYASYMKDYRKYQKDAKYTRSFDLSKFENVDLLQHLKEHSGRLIATDEGKAYYITGQYYPTEYQRGIRNFLEYLEELANNNELKFLDLESLKKSDVKKKEVLK